jgi:hypothetical protein
MRKPSNNRAICSPIRGGVRTRLLYRKDEIFASLTSAIAASITTAPRLSICRTIGVGLLAAARKLCASGPLRAAIPPQISE